MRSPILRLLLKIPDSLDLLFSLNFDVLYQVIFTYIDERCANCVARFTGKIE